MEKGFILYFYTVYVSYKISVEIACLIIKVALELNF